MTHATFWAVCMSSWRTSFTVKLPLRTRFLSGAKKLSQFVRKFFSQNKAKNAGRSGKNAGMREIRQHAGFPARLRDG